MLRFTLRLALGLAACSLVAASALACCGVGLSSGASTGASIGAAAPAAGGEAPETASQDATPDESTAPPAPLANTIRWQTATEVENFGFDVYRGDSEEGPFVRLTERPIAGAGTSDVPTRYEFVDDTIEPETAYYYYVESISTGGVRERFTPVFRSKPKPAPEP
jgi:hypothetical protein